MNKAIAVLYLVVLPLAIFAIAVGGIVRTDRLARQGQEAHRAICTFRADLKQRADNSSDLLNRTKGDIKIGTLRFQRANVIAQLKNQEAALRSLDNLHC